MWRGAERLNRNFQSAFAVGPAPVGWFIDRAVPSLVRLGGYCVPSPAQSANCLNALTTNYSLALLAGPIHVCGRQGEHLRMNVVDMNGRPFAADRRVIDMDPEIVRRLREVDPTKLLGYLASVLPVANLDFQVKFVLDRDGWLRDCIERVSAELDE